MKKCLFFAFLIAITCGLFAQDKPVLKIGWEDWKPYQFKTNDGNHSGLDLDLIKAIAQNAGYKIEFSELPWSRHLKMVENGTVDIALGASKNPEREAYAHFTIPYRTEEAVLYVRKEDAEKYSFDSLQALIDSNFRLGARREYYYGEEYDAISKTEAFKKVQIVDKDDTNCQKLAGRRIDGMLIDPYVGAAIFKKLGMHQYITKHSMKIYSDDIYIMVSKNSKHENLYEDLNNSLKELKANGKLQEIINSYL